MKVFSWIKNLVVNAGSKSADTQKLGGIFRLIKSSNNQFIGIVGYVCYTILIDVNPEMLAIILSALGVTTVAFKRIENSFKKLGEGISGKGGKE